MYYLLDTYLNTPDKFQNETVLHFASKLGCVDIVELLVSYPECDRERRNTQGLTPAEVKNNNLLRRTFTQTFPFCMQLGYMCLMQEFYSWTWNTDSNSAEPAFFRTSSPTNWFDVSWSCRQAVVTRHLFKIAFCFRGSHELLFLQLLIFAEFEFSDTTAVSFWSEHNAARSSRTYVSDRSWGVL